MKADKFFSQSRAECHKQLVTHLERSPWGKGVFVGRISVPGATIRQIHAGAGKLFDRFAREYRRGELTHLSINHS